ncbi:MAG TPA: endonuclease III [Caldisericia bacterium]|nr:endonuclease III [Caldisericia bacterium]
MSRASQQVQHILDLLKDQYPLVPGLHYHNEWELLVAVILSAQTTDEMVNKVSPALFSSFPTPESMAQADEETISKLIRSVNYYKTKAKHLHQSSHILVQEHGGKIPDHMEELLLLPGVARKTANVVLTHAYQKMEGIVVDTHVMRLSLRLGLCKETKRDKIEIALMKITPKKHWGDLATLLVYHGRRVCKAQKPSCSICLLEKICPKIGLK